MTHITISNIKEIYYLIVKFITKVLSVNIEFIIVLTYTLAYCI